MENIERICKISGKCHYGKKNHHRARNEERKKKKLEKVMEEIEKLGVKSQIDYLVFQGFVKIPQTFKAFLKNNHDIEKTIAALNIKKEKKQYKFEKRKVKRKDLEEAMTNLNLNSEVEIIRNKLPHVSLKKILVALSKNDNDSDKTIDFLTTNSCSYKRQQKYKQLFPDDTEFDWGKYKEKKKELKCRYKKDKNFAEFKEEREENLKKEISEGITKLYLDGNNMLFVDSTIRNLYLKKKMKEACERLAELFYVYTSHNKLNTILVFDNGNIEYELESDGVKFKVYTARPKYETSDDALVEWAGGLSALDLATSLFVTSDRGLITRLIEKGASQVMKSGVWWKLVKDYLQETLFQEIINK